MSSLRAIDLGVVDDLVDFIRGRGYVLDFSDVSFSQFFAADLDVDIDDPAYADFGGSKGKRLKRFLQKVDDRTALRTLKALWEHRVDFLLRTGQTDPVKNAEARYLAVLNRLGGSPDSAQGPQEAPKVAFDQAKLAKLRQDVVQLTTMAPHPRGYAFETFLTALFETYGLKPREAFRNRGEQIDGSFMLAGEPISWRPSGRAPSSVLQTCMPFKASWNKRPPGRVASSSAIAVSRRTDWPPSGAPNASCAWTASISSKCSSGACRLTTCWTARFAVRRRLGFLSAAFETCFLADNCGRRRTPHDREDYSVRYAPDEPALALVAQVAKTDLPNVACESKPGSADPTIDPTPALLPAGLGNSRTGRRPAAARRARRARP